MSTLMLAPFRVPGLRAKSPKVHSTFGDLKLIESQASRCAIRIDAAAKTIAA